MIIAIDFDGTIARQDSKDWTQIGEVIPGAFRGIIDLFYAGYELQLWTCREKEALEIAINFLQKHDMLRYFSYINENPQWQIDLFGRDCRKSGADVFIDDRIIGFDESIWVDIVPKIKEYSKRFGGIK
jgi:hypothetical protein